MNKLLILPGYVIGIGCLVLISLRTLLAFFSESKAVTIYINHYGEQYLDLLSLGILWIIVGIGMITLYHAMKKEHKKEISQ